MSGDVEIRTKRIYEEAHPSDGVRILIDRLWPRGVSKERAAIDFWARRVAPSDELRRWYRHQPDKWPEFERRYAGELEANPEGIEELRRHLDAPVVTLVFSSREEKLNNATALARWLQRESRAS
jgi:uncharacterized protein YeaO (DUF488 family)